MVEFMQVNPKLLFEIKLHGFLLWASLGFLMPVGILVIRMSHREEHGRRVKIMFYAHVVLEASLTFFFLHIFFLISFIYFTFWVTRETAATIRECVLCKSNQVTLAGKGQQWGKSAYLVYRWQGQNRIHAATIRRCALVKSRLVTLARKASQWDKPA